MEKATVQSIDRALSIVETLASEKDGLGVTEIAGRVNLHKSTVHRLLSALSERGYVEQRTGGAYRLGMKLVELSSLYLNQVELKTEAQPYLRRLLQQTKQPVHLSILEDLEIVYIDKIESIHSIRMYSQIGRRCPALCTAMGKALLSGLPDAELCAKVRAAKIPTYTSRSITDPELLIKEIRSARQHGWSRDDQEHEPGIRCIAAPIRDYRGNVIAAVSTSGQKQVLNPARDEEIAGFVMEAAESSSQRIGYHP
ncbi:MAG: IclR family transcriptional regulator [Christensenellaceae bacterium]|jgi:DNA-binding IclR family transcriptional regulator|nr:IclR family transcriptional regulator [Christensenellaceae bacterium]